MRVKGSPPHISNCPHVDIVKWPRAAIYWVNQHKKESGQGLPSRRGPPTASSIISLRLVMTWHLDDHNGTVRRGILVRPAVIAQSLHNE